MIHTFIDEIRYLIYYVDAYEWSDVTQKQLETLLDADYVRVPITNYTIVGPLRKLVSPFSAHATTICKDLNIKVNRLEKAKLFRKDSKIHYDPLLEEVYPEELYFYKDPEPKKSFKISRTKESLSKLQQEQGWGWDDEDIDYIHKLFKELNRDPTFTELMDLAQSNNEHSRHWFFNANIILDDHELSETLFQLVKKPYQAYPEQNVIAFADNASAQKGYYVHILKRDPSGKMCIEKKTCQITLTAETHNFPTGVSPFPGAATGVGGRLRDQHAAGQGSFFGAGLAGYCVGALPKVPGQSQIPQPASMERPLTILIEASNGASDYGNKFGEPLIGGFTRSYAQTIDKQYISWTKPIMYSGGIGHIFDTEKKTPSKDDVVVKIGGPAYRIGLGGGSSSSLKVQGEVKTEKDEQAVQRGDPEMEQKLNRVIRACANEHNNILLSIHDQGAGGNGNVLKEIVAPTGADIYLDQFEKGDKSLSPWELWSSEYQESDAVLVKRNDFHRLKQICKRENVPCEDVGMISNTGRIQVYEQKELVVDLPLQKVLSDLPPKTFILTTIPRNLPTHDFKGTDQLSILLHEIWRLPSVGSKRFLTTKVDRSVTGLVAQQQCVGPLHLPLSNVAVKALSYWDYKGIATSIGEQPIKGLLDPAAGARMSVAECLTNLVWAQTDGLQHTKISGNWMWPAKMKGEGARMVKAVKALSDILLDLKVVLDGGKDSLSMAVNHEKETIIAPGNIVVTAYARCPDLCKTIQPVLQPNGALWLLPLSHQTRTGGSAWAQSQGHLGGKVPDVDHPKRLGQLFETVQHLIAQGLVLSGHDRSDGGLVTCLMEMAFAGNTGFHVKCPTLEDPLPFLLNEEVGVVVQIKEGLPLQTLWKESIYLGRAVPGYMCTISQKDTVFEWSTDLRYGRAVWEETSFMLEKEQAHHSTVLQEETICFHQVEMKYSHPDIHRPLQTKNVNMAVIRAEGCNGDQELQAAFIHSGFTVYDIHMNDLKDEDLCDKLAQGFFRGLAFSGGFSYADVLGAGKGWAYTISHQENIFQAFSKFKSRDDTFSLGVCNGCQVMSHLGWVKGNLKTNISQRFECRYSAVQIVDEDNIFFRGMKGQVLGVWVAHQEGRFSQVENPALKYVDTDHKATQMYPYNPNGSEKATAGVLSKDKRHLALMPHPERSFLSWQTPFGAKYKMNNKYTPWIQLFDNLYIFAVKK